MIQSRSEIIGILLAGIQHEQFSTFHLEAAEAWEDEIETLKRALNETTGAHPAALNWGIVLEYVIPRRQKRVDAVVLMGNVVCAFEFKTSVADIGSCRQVED
ncbi:MAG: hypothetical protein WBW69_00905, partial [Candidatus Korobacteraceae bacterium]